MDRKSSKIVEFPVQEEDITDKLFELFLEDPLAFAQFVKFCHAPHIIKLNLKDFKFLVSKGVVRANCSIPSDIRAAVLHTTALF